jgi:hypothetical protein
VTTARATALAACGALPLLACVRDRFTPFHALHARASPSSSSTASRTAASVSCSCRAYQQGSMQPRQPVRVRGSSNAAGNAALRALPMSRAATDPMHPVSLLTARLKGGNAILRDNAALPPCEPKHRPLPPNDLHHSRRPPVPSSALPAAPPAVAGAGRRCRRCCWRRR